MEPNNQIVILHIFSANADNSNLEAFLRDNPELVNCRGISNSTALHWASLHGSARVKELEMNECILNSLYFDHYAHYGSTIRLLHQYGADINAKMDGNITPVHLASAYGNVESLRALVELGANINVLDIHGDSPLEYSQRNRKNEIYVYLKSMIDSKCKTDFELCKDREGTYVKYSDMNIEFEYPDDFQLFDEDSREGIYSLVSYDDKVNISIHILSDANRSVFRKLIEDSAPKKRQKRTVVKNMEFGNNLIDGLIIEDCDKRNVVISKIMFLMINNFAFVRFESVNEGANRDFCDYSRFWANMYLKENKGDITD